MTTVETRKAAAAMHGAHDSPRKAELKDLIAECGAVRYGHFVLTSGRHSDIYVEKFRILERPWVLEEVCREIVEHFQPLRPEVVVGPTTGGLIVAYEVARQLKVPAVYVESEGKERKIRRNARIASGARAILVDDVLTTGVSITEVLPVLRSSQANVLGIGVLIDRSESPIEFGVDLYAACRFEAKSYDEADLPDWLAAIPAETPGTRTIRFDNPES